MFFLLEFFFSVLSKLELTFNVFLDHVQSIFLLFSFCFLVYMYVLLFGTSHYRGITGIYSYLQVGDLQIKRSGLEP